MTCDSVSLDQMLLLLCRVDFTQFQAHDAVSKTTDPIA